MLNKTVIIVVMEIYFLYVILALIGMAMGSFAGAMVWRFKARQLDEYKNNHLDYDKVQYKKIKKLINHKMLDDRSVCLNCSYQLRWFDMVPIFSWLYLRGKCRNCHHKIGATELLLEIGLASLFVLSFVFWPYALNSVLEVSSFILWLGALVGLAIMFVFDIKWFLLPNIVNFIVIAIGVVSVVIRIILSSDPGWTTLNALLSVLILSGLYYILHEVSKGKWVGYGDVKLGLGLGLLLADWQLAFLALFSANLVGTLIVVPMMLTGKLKRNSRVPFGPLLIVGFLVAQLWGSSIVEIYIANLIPY